MFDAFAYMPAYTTACFDNTYPIIGAIRACSETAKMLLSLQMRFFGVL